MILADAFQIRDRSNGLFLQSTIVDSVPTPVRWGYVWLGDQCSAGIWSAEYVDRFLESPEHWLRELDGRELEKVPGPACGCCGKIERGWVGPIGNCRWEVKTRSFTDVDGTWWRCEKHVGRNPCCIPGCRKTYAHKSGDWYDHTVMCGKCWRQAPKWMRDRESRIRRLARRRGWTDQLTRVHNMAWEACRRAIERQRLAPEVEVVETSAPPPPGLLAELQRLGL